MNRKILFVDDQENVLRAFQRNLGSAFDIDIAVGAKEGLAMADGSLYAAIVSDLRMPGMDGIRFLARIKENYPDVVRLMLSGDADLSAAMAAVNEGRVFQFLTKPCSTENLARALEAAVRQHELIMAERDLLERTLNGSIALMSEILSLVNPVAFSNAGRIRRAVRHMATQLRLVNLWELDLAAMLSQVGFIAVPAAILDKLHARQPLTPQEEEILRCHPTTGHDLLAQIPRLETVSEIVRHQTKPYRELMDPSVPDVVAIGAQLLMIANYLEEALSAGHTHGGAVRHMLDRPETYHPGLVATLEQWQEGAEHRESRRVDLRQLRTGMIIDEDLLAVNGMEVATRGQHVSEPLIVRLRHIDRTVGLSQPFRVLVPDGSAAGTAVLAEAIRSGAAAAEVHGGSVLSGR